jgi:hypothetical protein
MKQQDAQIRDEMSAYGRRLPNIFNITPDRFWLDAYFVSGMTRRRISVQPTSRAKKLLGLLQTFG